MHFKQNIGPSWGFRMSLVLGSAALHAAALPPWNAAGLIWVAIAPLLVALRGARPAQGLALGFLWGVATIWIIAHWVPAGLSYYYQQSLLFGVGFAMFAAVGSCAIYTAGFGACATQVPGPRVLWLAGLWVAWDWIRASVFGRTPWLFLGHALVPHPLLIQLADIGGAYAVTFVVAVVNAAVAEIAVAESGARARAAATAAAVVALAATYGGWRLHTPLADGRTIRVAVVQGNNDLGWQWQSEFYGAGLDRYLDLSRAAAAAQPDLILWPESAVTFFLDREPAYQGAIARTLADLRADLLTGGPYAEESDPQPRYFNSAFYVSRDGSIAARYDKTHLLAFAEYFPFRTIGFLRRRFERVRWFTPGTRDEPLATRLGNLGVMICFEGVFPEIARGLVARGAGLLVILSNDAWLGGWAGPAQHARLAVLRAVENRTWVIRATTTGVSMIVDPHGVVRAESAIGTAATLSESVVVGAGGTIYTVVGDAFAAACALAGIGAVLWRRIREPIRQE